MLYVNDLPGYVHCANLFLYADEAWLLDSELVLNTVKTCAMLFLFICLKYIDKRNIMYNNIVTAYNTNINSFALTLTKNLKWHAHIDILRKSLNSLSCIFSVSCFTPTFRGVREACDWLHGLRSSSHHCL
jgi:hypothetical protein